MIHDMASAYVGVSEWAPCGKCDDAWARGLFSREDQSHGLETGMTPAFGVPLTMLIT